MRPHYRQRLGLIVVAFMIVTAPAYAVPQRQATENMPNAPGLNINVTTKDGVVTLEGNVKSNHEKQRAEAIARDTQGVVDVRNQLTVSGQ